MARYPRAECRWCGRWIALTRRGFLWAHGPHCSGSGRTPGSRTRRTTRRSRHGAPTWPTYYKGRRVVTVPGPDTWNGQDIQLELDGVSA